MKLQTHRKAERWLGITFLGVAFLPIFGIVLLIVAGLSAPTFSPVMFVLIGLCFLLFLAGLGLSSLFFFMHKLFPSTLQVEGGLLHYLKRGTVIGQVPLTNIMKMEVLRPEEDGSSAAGGLAGGVAAMRHAEGIGFAFIVHDENDKDTFWPAALKIRATKFQIDIRFAMSYEAIHEVLMRLVPKQAEPEMKFSPPTEPAKSRSAPAAPPADDDPFNFG